jgi:hypothetical protein
MEREITRKTIQSKTVQSKTVGEYAYDLNLKAPETTNAVEMMEARLKGDTTGSKSQWDQIFEDAYNFGRNRLPNQDFYIDISGKWERILGTERPQIRLYPFIKRACPSPQYDQTVFKYHHKDDRIEYLWTLPDKDTYNWYVDNAQIVHPDRWDLLKFVLKDKNGELLRQAKTLNGEPL